MILYRQFMDTFAVHFHHSYLVDINFFLLSFFLLQKHGKNTFVLDQLYTDLERITQKQLKNSIKETIIMLYYREL